MTDFTVRVAFHCMSTGYSEKYIPNEIASYVERFLHEGDRKTFLLHSWTPSSYDFPVGFQERPFQVLEELKWCVAFARSYFQPTPSVSW